MQKPKIFIGKKINTDVLYKKIFSLFGLPDNRGFIYVEQQDPEHIEATLKKELNISLSDLALYITVCPYEKGTIIKL